MQHAQRIAREQMREFVAASGLTFVGTDHQEIDGVVEGTWQAHKYLRLSRRDKGVARRYLAQIGGRSWAPITRPRRLATELTYRPTG